ncbi:15615_t:CDS:2 [Gigaspora rosea]|nr:15615_t:CDS:2 [Gigaspora rosea]
MEHITAEYYRAGTPYLSPDALEEIIHSRGTIKNASREIARKYETSTRRIYEIWKLHAQGLPLRKQQIIQNVGSSKAVPISKNNTLDGQTKKRRSKSVCMPDLPSDSKDLIEKTNKEMEKVRVQGRTLTSQLTRAGKPIEYL